MLIYKNIIFFRGDVVLYIDIDSVLMQLSSIDPVEFVFNFDVGHTTN